MIGILDRQIYAMEQTDGGKIHYIPCFTCGHCSSVVIVNKERVERRKCLHCMRLICGTNEICNSTQLECIPLGEVMRDHFEGASKWVPYIDAIMRGATTLDAVEQKGVVNG